MVVVEVDEASVPGWVVEVFLPALVVVGVLEGSREGGSGKSEVHAVRGMHSSPSGHCHWEV